MFRNLTVLLLLSVFTLTQINRSVYADTIKSNQTQIAASYGLTNLAIDLAVSHNNRYFIADTYDQAMILWNLHTGKQLRRWSTNKRYRFISFSSDDKYLVGLTDNEVASWIVTVWNVESGEAVYTHTYTTPVHNVLFSPDPKSIYVSHTNGVISLLNWTTNQDIEQFHDNDRNSIMAISLSPDCKKLITGSYNGVVKIYDVQTGALNETYSAPSGFYISHVVITPDNKSVIASGITHPGPGVALFTWDRGSKKNINPYYVSGKDVYSDMLSSDGKIYVTGGNDKTLHVWDTSTGQEIRKITGHNGAIATISFCEDNKWMIVTDGLLECSIWNVESGREAVHVSNDCCGIRSAIISNDGRHLVFGAVSSNCNRAFVWDTQTGKKSKQSNSYPFSISPVHISADDKLLVFTDNDHSAVVWDWENEKEIHTYQYTSQHIRNADISPDEKYVAILSDDNMLKIYERNADVDEPVKRFPGNTLAAYSSDGKKLLIRELGENNEEELHLINVARENVLKRFAPKSNGISSFAFSPDTRYIASGGGDGIIRLWDIISAQEIRQFTGHTQRIEYVAFSRDGRYLVSSSADATARIWEVFTGKQISVLAGHLQTVTSAVFSLDGKYVLTGSLDKTARLWDTVSGNELLTLLTFKDLSWAVATPDGRYDGDDSGIAKLYYIRGDKTNSAGLLRNISYTPGLLRRMLEGEKLPKLDLSSVEFNKLPKSLIIIKPVFKNLGTQKIDIEGKVSAALSKLSKKDDSAFDYMASGDIEGSIHPRAQYKIIGNQIAVKLMLFRDQELIYTKDIIAATAKIDIIALKIADLIAKNAK